MRHPDEVKFLCRLASERPQQTMTGPTCDDIATEMGIPIKRAYFLYEKWGRQNIFESGVSDRMGWLTEKGLATAEEWRKEVSNGSDS